MKKIYKTSLIEKKSFDSSKLLDILHKSIYKSKCHIYDDRGHIEINNVLIRGMNNGEQCYVYSNYLYQHIDNLEKIINSFTYNDSDVLILMTEDIYKQFKNFKCRIFWSIDDNPSEFRMLADDLNLYDGSSAALARLVGEKFVEPLNWSKWIDEIKSKADSLQPSQVLVMRNLRETSGDDYHFGKPLIKPDKYIDRVTNENGHDVFQCIYYDDWQDENMRDELLRKFIGGSDENDSIIYNNYQTKIAMDMLKLMYDYNWRC